MTDDIVTRMRVKASRCTHGNERYYNGPEGIDAYLIDTCSWCYSWNEAADEIERLRAEVARLNTFLHPIGMIMNQEVHRG